MRHGAIRSHHIRCCKLLQSTVAQLRSCSVIFSILIVLWNVSHCHSVAAVSVIWSSKANIGPESSVRKYQFARDCSGLPGIVVLAAAPYPPPQGWGEAGGSAATLYHHHHCVLQRCGKTAPGPLIITAPRPHSGSPSPAPVLANLIND